jgi:hypothetical protein
MPIGLVTIPKLLKSEYLLGKNEKRTDRKRHRGESQLESHSIQIRYLSYYNKKIKNLQISSKNVFEFTPPLQNPIPGWLVLRLSR